MLNLFGVAMDFPIIQSQSTTLQRWHPWQEYPHTCWGHDHQKMNHWDRTTGHRDTNINQWHHTASSECSKLLYIWFSLMAKPFSFTGIGQETKKPEWPRHKHTLAYGEHIFQCVHLDTPHWHHGSHNPVAGDKAIECAMPRQIMVDEMVFPGIGIKQGLFWDDGFG